MQKREPERILRRRLVGHGVRQGASNRVAPTTAAPASATVTKLRRVSGARSASRSTRTARYQIDEYEVEDPARAADHAIDRDPRPGNFTTEQFTIAELALDAGRIEDPRRKLPLCATRAREGDAELVPCSMQCRRRMPVRSQQPSERDDLNAVNRDRRVDAVAAGEDVAT